MHHALVAVAVAFVLGASLDRLLALPAALTWWNLAIVTGFAAVAFLAKLSRLATGLLLVAVALTGLLRSQLFDPTAGQTHFLRLGAALQPPVKVRVGDVPQEIDGRLVFTGQLVGCGDGRAASGAVRVALRNGTALELAYADLFSCSQLPRPIPDDLPGERNGRARALALRGVLGQLTLDRAELEILERDTGNPILAGIYGLRRSVSRLLAITHEASTAAFLRSFLLGENSQMDPVTLKDFSRTGTIHILSQSGQHVALLALVVVFLFRWLPLGRTLPALLTAFVLVVYALMTGARPSVVRAVIMALCIIGSQLADRKHSPYNGVALAALLLLVYDPTQMYSVGFQLSFAAVLSLLALTPWLMQFFKGFSAHGNSLLSASVAAYLGTAPLMLYHFGTFSTVALAANLFVLPIAAIVMPTALLALTAALFSTHLAYVLAAANFGFVKILTAGLHWMAAPVYAEVSLPAPSPTVLILYYLVVLIVSDRHNVARLLGRRQPIAEKPSANADWSWILANRPMDPLMERLEGLLGRQASLVPSEEVMTALVAKLGQDLVSHLDPVAFRYLAFSAHKLLEPAPEPAASGTIAVIATIMAVERELDARVFRFLRVPDAVARSEVARTHRKGHINKPPRLDRDVLALPLQSELLWYYLVPADGASKAAVHVLARELGDRLKKPGLYLEPSRLALVLDRILKKFYRPVLEGELFDRAKAQAACDEILGGAEHSLLREVVSAGSMAGPRSRLGAR